MPIPLQCCCYWIFMIRPVCNFSQVTTIWPIHVMATSIRPKLWPLWRILAFWHFRDISYLDIKHLTSVQMRLFYFHLWPMMIPGRSDGSKPVHIWNLLINMAILDSKYQFIRPILRIQLLRAVDWSKIKFILGSSSIDWKQNCLCIRLWWC